MTSTEKLQSKVIDNIRQINLDTFPVVIEICCCSAFGAGMERRSFEHFLLSVTLCDVIQKLNMLRKCPAIA